MFNIMMMMLCMLHECMHMHTDVWDYSGLCVVIVFEWRSLLIELSLPVVCVFVFEEMTWTSMCRDSKSLPRNGGDVTSVTVRM